MHTAVCVWKEVKVAECKSVSRNFNIIAFPTPGHLSEQDYDASSLSLSNPTFNSSRVSFVRILCPLVLGQLLFCVARFERTGLLPALLDCCLVSGLHYIMHIEGIRK